MFRDLFLEPFLLIVAVITPSGTARVGRPGKEFPQHRVESLEQMLKSKGQYENRFDFENKEYKAFVVAKYSQDHRYAKIIRDKTGQIPKNLRDKISPNLTMSFIKKLSVYQQTVQVIGYSFHR